MTNQELINELQKYPPYAIVVSIDFLRIQKVVFTTTLSQGDIKIAIDPVIILSDE